MATSTHLPEAAASANASSRRNPIVLWHLLSLDAPSVAALWTWFIARASHVVLPWASPVAMALAVWLLYAADRLLDSRSIRLQLAREELELRHFFHRSNRLAFLLCMAVAAVVLATLLPLLPTESRRLYCILGAMLLGYFILIHSAAASRLLPFRLAKELAVGFFFSAAIFIPTISRRPELRLRLFPAAILFAAICSLNCLFIYAWEHPAPLSPRDMRPSRPASRNALSLLPVCTVSTALISLALPLADRSVPWQIPLACAMSTVMLLTLHRSCCRLHRTTLRAAADLCLLTPLLLLPLTR